MEGEWKVTRLSPMDNVMPRFYTNLILFFRLAHNQDIHEVHASLDKSLLRTLPSAPLLPGSAYEIKDDDDQVHGRGRLEIRVHSSARPTLLFNDLTEDSDCEDLEDLQQTALTVQKLIPPLGLPDTRPDGPGALVFAAQANYIRGGLLLGLTEYHPVIDGASGTLLVRKWAENTRILLQEEKGQADTAPRLDITPDSHDPGILERLWHEAENVPDYNQPETADDDTYRLIGLSAPNLTHPTVGLERQTSPPRMRSTIFYVSKASFAALRARADSDIQETEGGSSAGKGTIRPGASDALMALLWRAICKARFPPDEEQTQLLLETATESALDTTLNGRALFSSNLPWTYLGSLVFINTTRLPLSTLLAPETTLGSIAQEVRTATDTITPSKLHEGFGLAATLSDYKALSYPFATFAGTEVCISSWLAWSLYDADFGSLLGCPETVRLPHGEFDAVCRQCVVLPLQVHGGFEIVLSMKEEEMGRMETDEEFMRWAKVVSN
ncbi:transferase family-domain-containing protein [Aspergillus pseudoustus]|uniref:Transferase family-domain-containing protein n=1 Tax=Aspergillus pseudoustus TaxID=1810923 RepID=A0ABR4J0V5_9EURO